MNINKYKNLFKKIEEDEEIKTEQESPPEEEDKVTTSLEDNKSNKREERIWIGSRRHTIMWKSHTISFFLTIAFLYTAFSLSFYFIFLLTIPAIISLRKIKEIRRNTFEITNKRLKMKVFKNNRFITSEVELYNVKHVNLEEKRNGKGYLIFVTNSKRYPQIRFPHMENPSIIHDKVRDIVEELKLQRTKMTPH